MHMASAESLYSPVLEPVVPRFIIRGLNLSSSEPRASETQSRSRKSVSVGIFIFCREEIRYRALVRGLQASVPCKKVKNCKYS